MKFVYVLERGKSHENDHLVGLYNNEDSALWDLAIAFNERFDMYKGWKVIDGRTVMMPRWSRIYRTGGPVEFQSGCDYWVVTKREIYD